MLPGMMGGQMGVLQPNANMIEVIRTLGLEANLKLCLDAGDAASYTSGQTWSDRSGGAYDFFRGTTSGAEGSDPTFNGVAGRQSSAEYFSVDGGDWFTLGQANPTWVTQMHKAGAKFTFLEWSFANAVNASKPYGGIGDPGSGGTGVAFQNDASTGLGMNIQVVNVGATVLSVTSTAHINNSAWNLVGLSVDATAPTEVFIINGTTESHATAFSSPSSSGATNTIQIGAIGAGFAADVSGNRFGAMMMWDRALSASELLSVWTATRAKFGL